MPGTRIVVADEGALAEAGARWIVDAIRASIRETGTCSLALAGGNTPKPVYRRLADTPGIPWIKVSIFFADERAVPPDNPDSNYGMAHECLLSRLPVPPAAVHRMEAESDDLSEAAKRYEALLPDPLDIVLLGMGPDGHTASLFPYAPALGENARRVVAVRGGEPLLQRLTVTPPVIEGARRALVMVSGVEKADLVARALASGPDDIMELPIQLARERDWLLDRAAASKLAAV